jgi:hypothetical protein
MSEEIVYEESESRAEIIATCHYALASIESYDYAMLDEESKMRIDNIKRKALILIDGFLDEIYYENYED